MDTAFVIAVPAAAMIAAHYIPWARFFGRPLPRTGAYALGLLAILLTVTFVWWLTGEQSAWIVVLWFWLSSSTAGGATLIAYAIDSAVERAHKQEDEIERLRTRVNSDV